MTPSLYPLCPLWLICLNVLCVPKLPADVRVIPGHGAVSTLDDVRAYVTMLKETLAAVQKGVQQGKTLDQRKQEKVLDP